MRALGSIHTFIQKPFTTYGMPPRLTMIVLAFVAIFYAFMAAVGLAEIAFIGSVLIVCGVCPILWLKNRKDWHFEAVLMNGKTRWKNKEKLILIAGRPTNKKGKK